MKTTIKIQKELNKLATLEMISGELFLTVETMAKDLKELDQISDEVLAEIEAPKGFKKFENQIYRKGLNIYISFTK